MKRNAPLGDVLIRPAANSDAAVIAQLLIEQMREHRIERQPSEMLAAVREILAGPHWGFILVASSHDIVLGVAYLAAIMSAEHGGKIGWVEEIFVSRTHRERGIGSALLGESIQRAKQLGWLALELEVDIEHRRAEALYQRLGFVPLPRSRWVLAI